MEGSVQVYPEYEQGLCDLEGFSHIIILYHFHQVRGWELKVTPFLDSQPRGVFATRAPKRPNPMGLSVVELLSRQGSVLHIRNVDVLDGTPLLDVKPYVAAFDTVERPREGWLEEASQNVREVKSDSRFK